MNIGGGDNHKGDKERKQRRCISDVCSHEEIEASPGLLAGKPHTSIKSTLVVTSLTVSSDCGLIQTYFFYSMSSFTQGFHKTAASKPAMFQNCTLNEKHAHQHALPSFLKT